MLIPRSVKKAVGPTYMQVTGNPDDVEKPFVRVIEITSFPTPSSPYTYRVLRNDAHPHRVGRKGSIRRADLDRKYVKASA